MRCSRFKATPQSSNPDIPAIIFHSSRLSSVLPKKNPTAHSKGLSSDSAGSLAEVVAMLVKCGPVLGKWPQVSDVGYQGMTTVCSK